MNRHCWTEPLNKYGRQLIHRDRLNMYEELWADTQTVIAAHANSCGEIDAHYKL